MHDCRLFACTHSLEGLTSPDQYDGCNVALSYLALVARVKMYIPQLVARQRRSMDVIVKFIVKAPVIWAYTLVSDPLVDMSRFLAITC